MDLMVRVQRARWIPLTTITQEVNPSLSDDFNVKQTVSVGCSLVRSALGKPVLLLSGRIMLIFLCRRNASVASLN